LELNVKELMLNVPRYFITKIHGAPQNNPYLTVEICFDVERHEVVLKVVEKNCLATRFVLALKMKSLLTQAVNMVEAKKKH